MDPKEVLLITVRLSADRLAALDDWRRVQGDMPTRPEAIRRLVDIALDAEQSRGMTDPLARN